MTSEQVLVSPKVALERGQGYTERSLDYKDKRGVIHFKSSLSKESGKHNCGKSSF